MKTIFRAIGICAGLLAGLVVLGMILSHALAAHDPVKASAFVSPNGQWRAVLMNSHNLVDTNVRVTMGRNAWWAISREIYISGDSNRLTLSHSGRLLWSADSRQLLLVGEWNLKNPELRFTNGEAPLMFYDFATGAVRSNGLEDNYPQLSSEDISGAGCGLEIKKAPVPASGAALGNR
jgi:hypothetical protein